MSRERVPTRSSTVVGPHEHERRPHEDSVSHARSEDLSHSRLAPSSFPSQSSERRMSITGSGSSNSSCASCNKPIHGAFVRAIGAVFHLDCFKCLDCGDVVAAKFFPIEAPDGRGQQPLCERDYFRRLNLICAKCGTALRGSYITACGKKFHVEHFTCSLCDTLFGPQDSYYEHDSDVYCHFHYSTRFATKCVGCSTAILKQFVEINRNGKDECWHPECYMINKFWNVRVVSRRHDDSYEEEEARESHASLKEKQVRMEQQVYRIWTVLSAFEESSAACISDMLRQVSSGAYLDAIRMAEKFILHVEVLFAAIDDLEWLFAAKGGKGMSHVREARMLCRKTVDLFTLLSHTQETGTRRIGMTQELLALVTGLAHYLKILIRIALTGALKLEREPLSGQKRTDTALVNFLDKLHLLAVQGGDPTARRLVKAKGEVVPSARSGASNTGTQDVTYGFKSLAPECAGESPFSGREQPGATKVSVSASHPPSDLCLKCSLTVEEDCVRLGTYQRWHSHCVQCRTCGKVAAVPLPPVPPSKDDDKTDKDKDKEAPKLSTARRPPATVGLFVYEVESMKQNPSCGEVPTVIFCTEHGHPNCRAGFKAVSRLEQYAFLLNVALRRLYLLLKKQGVVPLSPTPSIAGDHDPYRDSGDIMRMKSNHLDRKLSATARLPKRSTIVESPTGKSAHPSDAMQQSRSQDLRQAPQQHHPAVGGKSPPLSFAIPHRASASNLNNAPPRLDSIATTVIKPNFTRNNTNIKIVDESGPSSPSTNDTEQHTAVDSADDGITLADLPQLIQAAQAHENEQERPLPRISSVPYIAELSALELSIVKHCAVLALSRSALRDQFDLDEMIELVEVKKGGFWNKLFKQDKKNNLKKNKGVFGVPLELLVERDGSDSLLGATRANMRVPSFIDDVISAMRQMDMSVEGIFRKNGNIRRLNEVTEAIDRDPSSVELTTDNPVQLAALLKKFLRDLPDPLLTFKLHKLFIAAQNLPSEDDRINLMHLVQLLLPKAHRDVMEVLFVFLKWVASFSHLDAETGSKMDLGNLATVICPSILYSRGSNALRDEQFGAIRVVTMLLENQDRYFTVPEEFIGILHDQEYFANSLELPGKEFMKKCDNYMRGKANGRNTGPMSPTLGPSSPYPNHVSRQPLSDRSHPSDPHMRKSQSRQQSPQGRPAGPSPSAHGSPSGPGSIQGVMQFNPSRKGSDDDEWRPPQRNPPSANGSPPSRPSSMHLSSTPPQSSDLHDGEFLSTSNGNGAMSRRI